MRKEAVVCLVMVLGLLVVPVPGAAAEETTERNWWPLNENIAVEATEGGGVTKYLQVEEGEVLTVNWLAVNMTQGWMYVNIYPSIPPLNWTNMTEETTYSQSYCQVMWTYHQSPPQSSWMRLSGHDVLKVNIQAIPVYGTNWIPITINMTVTRDEWTPVSDAEILSDRIDELGSVLARVNSTMSNLSANLSELEGALGDLRSYAVRTREMLEELNTMLSGVVAGLQGGQDGLWENLSALQASLQAVQEEIDMLGLCETADYQTIQSRLMALNDSLMQAIDALRGTAGYNDTALWEALAELRDRPGPDPYNDSALWEELERLRGNVSTVYNTVVNNTTVQQPVMYVNRTGISEPDGSMVIAGAAAGVVVGVLPTLTVLALYDRRVKKRYGGVSPPATDKI